MPGGESTSRLVGPVSATPGDLQYFDVVVLERRLPAPELKLTVSPVRRVFGHGARLQPFPLSPSVLAQQHAAGCATASRLRQSRRRPAPAHVALQPRRCMRGRLRIRGLPRVRDGQPGRACDASASPTGSCGQRRRCGRMWRYPIVEKRSGLALPLDESVADAGDVFSEQDATDRVIRPQAGSSCSASASSSYQAGGRARTRSS